MAMDWNHVLNWRLLAGSHEFPGPDGGTCINEAAIVAAGFEYKKINSAYDCPPCFSTAISSYAITLNDKMPSDLRQELLMPFVVRLAGTADTQEVEIDRATYIAIQTVKRILPKVLVGFRGQGFRGHAMGCEAVTDLDSALLAARCAKDVLLYYKLSIPALAVAAAITAIGYIYYFPILKDRATVSVCKSALAAAYATETCTSNEVYQREIYTTAVAILDEAIRLGNHSENADVELVVSRMNKIREHETV
jgi:hypothetical protein